jgi:hypothetical protein
MAVYSFQGGGKEGSKQPNMGPFNENVRAQSNRQGSIVIIKDDRTGYRYPASMFKCGKSGMYLESNYAPRPGKTLHILFDGRKRGDGACTYPVVIQWRKLLYGYGPFWSYGLGLEQV